jgi:hypothetical protein
MVEKLIVFLKAGKVRVAFYGDDEAAAMSVSERNQM